jgi:DNA gyrase subunit B
MIKDNDALETYLISNAIDELSLHTNAEAPAITGEALAKHKLHHGFDHS